MISKRWIVCFWTLSLNNFKILVFILNFFSIFSFYFYPFYYFYCYSVYAIPLLLRKPLFRSFLQKIPILQNQIWSKIDSSNRIFHSKFFKYVVSYNHAQIRTKSIYNILSTTNFFFRSAFSYITLFLCFMILRKHRLFDPVSKTS